jgi:hypothetical protein
MRRLFSWYAKVRGSMSIKQMTSTLHHRRSLVTYALLTVVNVVLFSWTTPLESSAVIVVAGFVVVSLDFLVLTWLFVRFLGILVPKSTPYKNRLTVTLVSFAIVALALASLGQLTGRDLIVVIIIWLLGYLYSLRFTIGHRST